MNERFDLYYSEVLGPVPESFHGFQSAPKTEEVCVLRDVSMEEAAAYMDLISTERSFWRVEPPLEVAA